MTRLVSLVAVLLSWPAWADSRAFDVDHLQLAASSGDFLATEGAGWIRPWGYRAQLAYRYLDAPLILESGRVATTLIGARSLADVVGAFEVGHYGGLGIDLPILLSESGSDAGHGAALGDVRLVPRIELLQHRLLGLAVLPVVRLPTGDTARFLGEGGAVFEPRLAAEARAGRVRMGTNVGVRIRSERQYVDLRVGNELYASLAAAVAPRPWIDVIAELHVDTALSSRFLTRAATPLEVLVGAGGHLGPVRVGAAVGAGLIEGFGSPRFRLLFTAEYQRLPVAQPRPVPTMVAMAPPPPPPAPTPPEPPPPAPVEEHPEPDVTITASRIELGTPIFFDTNRRRVRHQFFDELEQLARVINARPNIKRVWIEGHTDKTGPERWNLELSRRRAQSVAAFLMSRGVASDRLSPVGFGEARPLDPDARGPSERNRRVMFFTDSEPPAEHAKQTAPGPTATAVPKDGAP